MSRNGFAVTPRKATRWTSHLRQFSRLSADAPPDDASVSSEAGLNSPYPITPQPGALLLSSPSLRARSPDSESSNATIRESSPAAAAAAKQRTPQFARTCTVTVNESFTRDEVLVNLNYFDHSVQPGQLMAIDVLPDQRPGFGSYRRSHGRKDESAASPVVEATDTSATASSAAGTASADGTQSSESGTHQRYLFIVKDMPRELKARHPSVEIYVAKHIADVFGMKKGSSVLLTRVDASNPAVEASHVELVFKDQYLSRADMWRLAVAELSERTVYSGQRLLFMNTIKAQVMNVYVEGRCTQSAFFGKNTRPIFRSESARYVLFIQMAREMWDFDSDGSGEIIFSKVVQGFLPTLFKKWAAKKVKHLVTIVLFARVEYDAGLSFDLTETPVGHDYYTGVQTSGNRRPYKDFYRVVVSEMASGEWTRILHQLKREFNLFRRDISLHHLSFLRPDSAESVTDDMAKRPSISKQQHHIQAESSPAMYGNVLEAINMATGLYAYDYVDRDLTRTGISVAIITPGSGVFEVDYEAMRRTTEAVIGNGIGIDLICMPNMPLHSAPLFRFRQPHSNDAGMNKSRPFAGQSPSQNLSGSHGHSLGRSQGIIGSTPKQSLGLYGSYSSMGGSSLSPGKATEATMRGFEAMAAERASDCWSYAFPQWLHVSYWASQPGELLMRQGVPPTPMDLNERCIDGDYREKEFVVRCRMYDLQMRGVLETNEIETTPLHMDRLFPRSAFRLSSGSLAKPPQEYNGVLVVRNKLPANTLYDQVHGFQRFSADRIAKQDDKSIWKKLQDYDATRQKLPTTRRHMAPGAAHGSRKEAADSSSSALRMALKKHHLRDADPSGHDDRRTSMSMTTTKKTERRPSEHRPTSSRRDSISSHSSSRMPKAMRQISLGQRGFGIAAPKAAIAEVRAETVAAAAPAHRTVPSVKAPTTIAAKASPVLTATSATSATFSTVSGFPKTETLAVFSGAGQRPGSSISTRTASRVSSEAMSQPIVIKGGQVGGETTVPRTAESLLSTTVVGRGETLGPDRDVQYSNALRAEDVQRLYNSKLLAEVVPEVPKALSLTAALMPWLALINPSKPELNKIDLASFNSRWQHVFPRPGEQRAMKWKTLCAPAAVPLTTESFPTKEQLQSEFQRQPYSVSQEADDDMLSEEPQSNEDLLRELISRRFAQGFQVVIGPAVAKAFGVKQMKIADIFCPGRFIEDGECIFMSMGNTIHQLSCTKAAGVEVNIFHRKMTELGGGGGGSGTGNSGGALSMYRPAIRTLLDKDYLTSEIDLMPEQAKRNWNYIDSYLAGHDEQLTESLRFWRARFVLIPMAARTATPISGESEEELRLEGIRRLGQMWQKHRIFPASERRFQHVGHRRKGTNPLDVVYKTEDPSLVIAAELETLPLLEGLDPGNRRGQLVTNRERFHKGNLNLAALTEAIQQPVENGGIRMQNRRWHLRLHYNCFIGSDMTSWLLDNFEDLESREEAEELGNMLMVSDEATANAGRKEREPEETGQHEKDSVAETPSSSSSSSNNQGIFVHVERRHPFRDGQYFYQITSEFAKPHPSSWFNSRKRETSVPPTPVAEQTPQRDATGRSGSLMPRTGVAVTAAAAAAAAVGVVHEEMGPGSGTTTPTTIHTTQTATGKKPQVVLSKMIKYDVDHRKRSYRPERVDLHYDRLHNPDNCYQIRLEWMNVTAKLIEDVVEVWAREALKYGLRLVEVPIRESCLISERNPFRRPYSVRLARMPPAQQPETYFDATSLAPQQQPGRHYYQKAILRKFGFVLDTEAASNFPANVDVSYSWGRPNFQHTQYIHRSGVLLAEITQDGHFLMLANRLYTSRTLMREKEIRGGGEPTQPTQPSQPSQSAMASVYGRGEPSTTPLQSPLLKATRLGSPRLRASVVGESLSSSSVGKGGGSVSGSVPGSGMGIGIGGLHKASAATGAVGTAGLSAAAAAAAAVATVPYVPEPETVKDEVEAFCSDEAALEAFYRETLLERQQPASVLTTPVVGPTAAAAAAAAATVTAAAAAIPETSIPVLGLPPGILGLGSIGRESSSGSASNHRLDLGAGDTGSANASPRLASPAFLSSRLLFRRGSVDDYGRQPE